MATKKGVTNFFHPCPSWLIFDPGSGMVKNHDLGQTSRIPNTGFFSSFFDTQSSLDWIWCGGNFWRGNRRDLWRGERSGFWRGDRSDLWRGDRSDLWRGDRSDLWRGDRRDRWRGDRRDFWQGVWQVFTGKCLIHCAESTLARGRGVWLVNILEDVRHISTYESTLWVWSQKVPDPD